jgi:hypothetical protein
VNIQEQVDTTAFAMLSLSPEQREACFVDAFDQVLAQHPELDHVPPAVVAFVAAVMKRIAQLEQRPKGTA